MSSKNLAIERKRMDPTSKNTKMIFLVGAIGVGVMMFFGPNQSSFFPTPASSPSSSTNAAPSTSTPTAGLTPATSVASGQKLYEKNCMACHGKNAKGTEQGPTFIHKVYEPNHHGDGSFVVAAKLGVRAHHWRFGNMPAQPQVNEQQVLEIIKYIRKLQKTAGIF